MPAAPDFWWHDAPRWPSTLLAPLGSLYGAATAHRMARPGRRVAVPVICIGNFVVGGAGKTPVALDLVRRLGERGERPAVLSRGYGRGRGGPTLLRVDPARHDAAEVGDEPLLLARLAPTYVAADRAAAADAAIGDGATVLVLDDGLQNPTLAKSAVVAVVDGGAGIGNGRCIPAGPLRAPMPRQWPHVSALCVIGEGVRGKRLAAEAARLAIPVIHGRLEPDITAVEAFRGRRLLAFSGIGRPDKFFSTVEDCGLTLVGTRAFPDHHRFSADDRSGLLRDAARLHAELVTTEKDRVRLPGDWPVWTLPVRLDVQDPEGLERLIDGMLGLRPG